VKAPATPSVARARRDVQIARDRLAEAEEEIEQAEQRLAEEERKTAPPALRLTDMEIRGLEKADAALIARAADELRDLVLGAHDRYVLAAIRNRLDGYERDLIERLLELTSPRRAA